MPVAEPIVNQPAKPLETYTFTKEDIENLALEITKNVRASLVGGKVPEEQLPSYVDDVIEGYYYNDKFYEDSGHTKEIAGEKGKIYVDLTTANTYRWSGTVYIQVSSGKPIYIHPITIYNGTGWSGLKYTLNLFILNQESTAFATRTALLTYLKENISQYLLTGAIHSATYYLSPSCVVKEQNDLLVIGIDSNGDRHSRAANTINFDNLVTNAEEVTDSVNKIN